MQRCRGVAVLAAAERQHFSHQIPGALTAGVDLSQVLFQLFIIDVLHLEQRKFAVTHNARQHVVKVMGDTPGQLPHCFHLLRLLQLFLEYFACILAFACLGNVFTGNQKAANDTAIDIAKNIAVPHHNNAFLALGFNKTLEILGEIALALHILRVLHLQFACHILFKQSLKPVSAKQLLLGIAKYIATFFINQCN